MMGEASAAYHPGQAGTLRLGPKKILAEYGVLHPKMVKQFDLYGSVVAAEIFLDAIQVKLTTGFMLPPYVPHVLTAVKRALATPVPPHMDDEQLVLLVRNATMAVITIQPDRQFLLGHG